MSVIQKVGVIRETLFIYGEMLCILGFHRLLLLLGIKFINTTTQTMYSTQQICICYTN